MHTTRPFFRLSVFLLLCATSGACIVIEDDDDASNDDGSTEGAMTTTATTEGNDQGRSVRFCEARVVCLDGSVTEVAQSLCLTPAETAMELGFIQEACIEDMATVCEDIGDGSSLECSAECSAAMEPCECEDPTQGCEV